MPSMLMVDNAALFRMLEGTFLRRDGWDIVSTAHVTDLLTEALKRTPSLLLLDATGGAAATDCLRALRADARTSRLPVVVLAGERPVPECDWSGADATLPYPLTAAGLESTLSSLGRVDARRLTRRPVRWPARVGLPEGVVQGRVKDISLSGAFVALDRPVALETTVHLEMTLPATEGGGRLGARAFVVRRVEDHPGSHLIAGVGVRFTGMDAGVEARLGRFVGRSPLPRASAPASDREIG